MRDFATAGSDDAVEADATHRALWARLVRLNRAVVADLRVSLRDCGDMTLPQYDVLTALSRAPDGLKMSALSEALHVSNGNVTGIVERLVEHGLVARAAVPGDRRATLVRLTERGAAARADLAACHDASLGRSLHGLDSGRAAALISLLDATAAGGLSSAP